MTFDFDDFDVRERFYLVEEKSKRLQLLLETLPVRDQEFFRVTCSQAFIYHDSALDGMVISDEEIKSVFNSTPGGYYRKSRVFQEIKNHRNLLDKMLGQSALHKARNTAYSAAIVSYNRAACKSL